MTLKQFWEEKEAIEDTLELQISSLKEFATSLGYLPRGKNGKPSEYCSGEHGFICEDDLLLEGFPKFISLEDMVKLHNETGLFKSAIGNLEMSGRYKTYKGSAYRYRAYQYSLESRIVENIGIQYSKKIKELTTTKKMVKFL